MRNCSAAVWIPRLIHWFCLSKNELSGSWGFRHKKYEQVQFAWTILLHAKAAEMFLVPGVIPCLHGMNFLGWANRHSGHVCGETAAPWMWQSQNRSRDFCNACAAEPQGWCSWVAQRQLLRNEVWQSTEISAFCIKKPRRHVLSASFFGTSRFWSFKHGVLETSPFTSMLSPLTCIVYSGCLDFTSEGFWSSGEYWISPLDGVCRTGHASHGQGWPKLHRSLKKLPWLHWKQC